VVGRTISERTAAELRAILEAVVEPGGTATRAKVEGYTVAGKTGTAKKLVNGSYRGHNDYNVSFAGFVPSRDPVFTIIVVVDTPRKVSPYGGVVAAPIFQKVADAALRHRGVPPTLNAPPPVLVARTVDVQQQPAAGPVALPAIVPATATAGDEDGIFPDLAGMNARDAVQRLARMGIAARVHGAGFVVNQQPAAGSPLPAAAFATVWLERHPREPAAPKLEARTPWPPTLDERRREIMTAPQGP
jgi:cell division protein FtsI (penicillin-binding protein 3)